MIDLKDLPSDITPDYLIIPGGPDGSCDHAILDQNLRSLIRQVNSRSRLLAAICDGVVVLASARVLTGHQCTHTAVSKYAPVPEFEELLRVATPLFEGSTYVDEDIVHSGNIITAKPGAAGAFAKAILRKLKLE